MSRNEGESSVPIEESYEQEMPKEWHFIRRVLVKELSRAATFHDCVVITDALFHVRLVAESMARDATRFKVANDTSATKEAYRAD